MMKKKLLYLVDKNYYLTKMSRVRFHSINALNKYYNVIYWGNGWDDYNPSISVQKNIDGFHPDTYLVVCFKPLNYIDFCKVEIPTVIRYNEMFDKEWTRREIRESNPSYIICHHHNDYLEYVSLGYKNLIHIPHSAEKSIFYDMNLERNIDIMVVGSLNAFTILGRHYPLRDRIASVLNKIPLKYKCQIYPHPPGNVVDASTDRYLKEFSLALNKTKIAISCSGVPKSRFGKYIEIPMCGTVMAGDVPNDDQENIKKYLIELDMSMSDDEIISKLVYYLENDIEREKKKNAGLLYSEEFTQEKYAERFFSYFK